MEETMKEKELKAYLADTVFQLEHREALLREWLYEARFLVANTEEKLDFEKRVRIALGEEIHE
jgi:hypothetical protein